MDDTEKENIIRAKAEEFFHLINGKKRQLSEEDDASQKRWFRLAKKNTSFKVEKPPVAKPPELANLPIRVEHNIHAGRWCFLAESSKTVGQPDVNWQDDAYHVDLEENPIKHDGSTIYVGGCDCPNFSFARQKVINTQGRPSRCRHIKAVLAAISSELVSETIQKEHNRNRLFKFFQG